MEIQGFPTATAICAIGFWIYCRPQRPQNDSDACQEPVENVHTNVHTNVHNVHKCPTAVQENVDVLAESGRESGGEGGRSEPIEDKGCGENVDVLDACPEPFDFAQDKLRRRVVDVDTNEELTELVSFVRVAIAENDPALAKNILTVLTEVCGSGAVDRQQVWAALTNDEQQALTLLLSQPEPKPQQLELFPQKKESD